MITVINSGGALVAIGVPGPAEFGLTNISRVELPNVNYVAVGTGSNMVTYTNRGLLDGAIIAVDGGGLVQVTDGPDLQLWAIAGFAGCITVLGFFIVIRWAYRVFFGAAGTYKEVAD